MDELTLSHELTLFRDFRSDVPAPSAAETAAARTRLLDAMAGQGAATHRPTSPQRRLAWLGRFGRPRFWAPVAAAVAVLAVVITMVLLGVPGPASQKQKPLMHQRHHTSHQTHGRSKFVKNHGTGSPASAGQHAGSGAASAGAPGKSGAPGSGGSGGSGPATPTTTALTVSPGTTFSAHQVTMTATVTDEAGSSLTGGGVTFALFPNGAASALDVCVNAPVTGNVATCTYTPTSAQAGTDAVRAQYGGYQQYESSGSAAVPLAVTAITTDTTLTVSPATADAGQTVTLTATVTDQAGDNLAGGTVGFFWSPAPVNGISTGVSVDICLDVPLTYDPATHDNVATCQYTPPSGLAGGTLDMQAEYGDSAGPYPGSISGTVAFTVQS